MEPDAAQADFDYLMTAHPDYLMTVEEIAWYIQVSPKHVRDLLLRPGKMRSTRLGEGSKSPYRSRKRWVDEYMDDPASGGPALGRRRRKATKVSP